MIFLIVFSTFLQKWHGRWFVIQHILFGDLKQFFQRWVLILWYVILQQYLPTQHNLVHKVYHHLVFFDNRNWHLCTIFSMMKTTNEIAQPTATIIKAEIDMYVDNFKKTICCKYSLSNKKWHTPNLWPKISWSKMHQIGRSWTDTFEKLLWTVLDCTIWCIFDQDITGWLSCFWLLRL